MILMSRGMGHVGSMPVCSHAALQGGMQSTARLSCAVGPCCFTATPQGRVWHLSPCLSAVGLPEAGWMHGWEQQGVSQCWGRYWEERVGRGEDGRELLQGHVGSWHGVGTQQWVQG